MGELVVWRMQVVWTIVSAKDLGLLDKKKILVKRPMLCLTEPQRTRPTALGVPSSSTEQVADTAMQFYDLNLHSQH